MGVRVTLFALLALAGCLACGTSPSTAPSGSEEQLALKQTTPHFRILADRAPAATLQIVADALEAAYPRITADLRTGDLAVVTASVWQDQASFYEAMRRNTGQVFTGSTGYVTGRQSIAIHATSSVATTASHEFAHVVSMAVNPTIANNPRWLWETVALFENRQFVDPATVDFLQAGRYPTLATLDSEFNANRQVYQVGYVLGEYIVSTWTTDGLLALIRSNGQVAATLGVSVGEFEQGWYAFLQARYHTPAATGTPVPFSAPSSGPGPAEEASCPTRE